MRIRPSQAPATPALPTIGAASQPTEGAEFASTLADVAAKVGGNDGGAATDASENVRPLAERWGEWGRGADADGFGPPPDPALFAGYKVGAAFRASPLNPNGITMDPAFTVPGYTGRGTPVPPGFFNLAYYNRYLREGGTPLEGFPALEAGKSLMATYGTYGDGRARATSFVASPPETPDDGGGTTRTGGGDGSDGPGCMHATSSASNAEVATEAAAVDAADTAAAPKAASNAAAASEPRAASTPPASTTESASVSADDGTSAVGATASVDGSGPLAHIRTAFEAEIAALVDALLRG